MNGRAAVRLAPYPLRRSLTPTRGRPSNISNARLTNGFADRGDERSAKVADPYLTHPVAPPAVNGNALSMHMPENASRRTQPPISAHRPSLDQRVTLPPLSSLDRIPDHSSHQFASSHEPQPEPLRYTITTASERDDLVEITEEAIRRKRAALIEGRRWILDMLEDTSAMLRMLDDVNIRFTNSRDTA